MSLLEVRRERKRYGARVRRPMSVLRLVGLLVAVLAVMRWLEGFIR